MSNKHFAICCLSLIAIIGLTSWLNSQAQQLNTQRVQWLSIEEAQARAVNSPRPIFVDVYTEWCKPCSKMDRETFRDPQVVDYLNSNFYPVKLNAESNEAILYKGNHTEARSLALKEWMVRGFPAYVILSPDMKAPGMELGYKNSDELMHLLHQWEQVTETTPAAP